MNDPADYAHSRHREILGHCEPLIVDVPAVLIGFHGDLGNDARERYLAWVRAVAEARWFAKGVEDLPWWKQASDADEIVGPHLHPDATTFDGHALDDDRLVIGLDEIGRLFEVFSGHRIADLSSPLRSPELIQGRVELTTIGTHTDEAT